MSKTAIPKGYSSTLSQYETQTAIGMIKRVFEDNLCNALNLKRISAPLFVVANSGLNDDLNGVERAVTFDIAETHTVGEVVHSLAKWKRQALSDYDFRVGNGLCTDMNAIRRDEEMDNIHSIYVDQWDWEKIIPDHHRNTDYLYETVLLIVKAICDTLMPLKQKYPYIKTELCRDVYFISAEELLQRYPDKSPKEREYIIVKEHKTVFITGIGGALSDGAKHDGRAPDYDDWSLNGDLLFWHDTLDIALEISSMGTRVTPEVLKEQLRLAGCSHREALPFHSRLLAGNLPQTMGGGIGQSRLSMLLLGKAHIGEVQSSIWDKATIDECENAKLKLL